MAETLRASNPQTPDTIPQTPDTTQNCGDSIVALPHLREQKGPISLTLGIDKSVKHFGAVAIAAVAIPIIVSIFAVVYAKSAHDKADFMQGRYDDLTRNFDALVRDNRIMGDDMRTIRTYLNLRGMPSSHEEVEEKASGTSR